MREKIAEIINNAILTYHSPTHQPYDAADKILALFPSLDGIMVEEDAGCFHNIPKKGQVYECRCNGTGTITRPAEWGDIPEEAWSILLKRWILELEGTGKLAYTKTGERLKIK